MLNSSSYSNNSLNISAVSGSLVKSHNKSYFVKMHIKSDLASGYFNMNPVHAMPNFPYDKIDIVVLQIMNTHEGYVFVEAIRKEDL